MSAWPRLAALLLTAGCAADGLCGPERCEAGSGAYGATCCCAPGACAEDRYNAVTRVETGLWTLVTRNDPAKADRGPEQNRAVIFRLPAGAGGNDGPSLLLMNGVGLCDSSLAGLRALERREKAPLRYIVSPGDWHHVYLAQYNEHFPNATVYVPPGRIPGLDPQLKYETLDLHAPLASLRHHFQVYLMKGLGQPFHLETPRYELFFFHPSTGTLSCGDIFFFYACDPPLKMQLAFPGLEKGEIVMWDAFGTSMFRNKTEGAESARVMLSLPFTRFVHVHGEQGSQVPPGAHPSAKDLIRAALTTRQGPLAPAALRQVQSKWQVPPLLSDAGRGLPGARRPVGVASAGREPSAGALLCVGLAALWAGMLAAHRYRRGSGALE